MRPVFRLRGISPRCRMLKLAALLAEAYQVIAEQAALIGQLRARVEDL